LGKKQIISVIPNKTVQVLNIRKISPEVNTSTKGKPLKIRFLTATFYEKSFAPHGTNNQLIN
jgi:hypothetical protein